MLGNPVSYANKKRKKPVLKQKKLTDGNEVVKSNPSKRHRHRLNGELDRLTDLLPFSEEIRSRLDKLSVLRLSVGYLRVKSYFNASMRNRNKGLMFPGLNSQNGKGIDTAGFSEGDLLLQALNGFVMVVTSEGSVFYVSPTIKDYLGFQESDVVHQCVFELIHSDDRALFRQQLHFALNPPADDDDADEHALQSCNNAVVYSPEQLPPENSSLLERSFVCRFRCLLDNSSGFLALKFQGRLKYLHGQRGLRDNGTCNKPQLALFTIAMPVQPPSIVEIRAKLLLFQTKHKLDFAPLGIDSRGKVILGYSETELCMKGSGYQLIHAADMMHCADKHMRMIKTGESGPTVFRLLSKSGGWLWVKANAKVIFKGGRPDFIISYLRALVNAEGEEHLRQRRLQLPFSLNEGEAVLYSSGPTVDVSQLQFNKIFNNSDVHKDVSPGSLLDCFLKQDETAYTQVADPPLPVDQVFKDSWALLSVPSDSWQDSGVTATTGAPTAVKEEAKQSVKNMIDKFEEMVQSGDLCSVLQNLDVTDTEVMEWEHALNRLNQDEDRQDRVSSELDGILTNDIFDYIDSVLFKEQGESCMNASPPSCLTAVSSQQQDPSTQAAQLSATGLSEPLSVCTYSPLNGIYSQQQDAMNGSVIAGPSPAESVQIFNSTQKLSCPQADANLPPPQHLQLQDIFSPSIELPQIVVPDAPADDGSAIFQSCGRAHRGGLHKIPEQTQSGQLLVCPQNSFRPPAMAANGQLLQSSVQQPNNAAHGVVDILPPLRPCNDFNNSSTPNVPFPFDTSGLQTSPPLETQCPQCQQQKLPYAAVMQNGHELMPACHNQTSEKQTLPHAGLWPRSVTRLNPAQHGGPACGQAATPSSCMFHQHFSCSPAGGDVLALSGSPGQRGTNVSLDQSPLQGSCYFQWSHSEPVVGTSAISQESLNISRLTAPSTASSSEHTLNMQHYMECNGQTPVNTSLCGLDEFTQQENYKRN